MLIRIVVICAAVPGLLAGGVRMANPPGDYVKLRVMVEPVGAPW